MDYKKYSDCVRYYLNIESKLIETNQYVEHCEDNMNAYSNEFANIIMLSGSELDLLLKDYSKLNGEILNDKKYNMGEYKKHFKDNILKANIEMINQDITISPFENYDPKNQEDKLEWWVAYNNIKHNRIAYKSDASLKNALYIIAAHYIILNRTISKSLCETDSPSLQGKTNLFWPDINIIWYNITIKLNNL